MRKLINDIKRVDKIIRQVDQNIVNANSYFGVWKGFQSSSEMFNLLNGTEEAQIISIIFGDLINGMIQNLSNIYDIGKDCLSIPQLIILFENNPDLLKYYQHKVHKIIIKHAYHWLRLEGQGEEDRKRFEKYKEESRLKKANECTKKMKKELNELINKWSNISLKTKKDRIRYDENNKIFIKLIKPLKEYRDVNISHNLDKKSGKLTIIKIKTNLYISGKILQWLYLFTERAGTEVSPLRNDFKETANNFSDFLVRGIKDKTKEIEKEISQIY